jgi:tRNA pseudouridine55 synthase
MNRSDRFHGVLLIDKPFGISSHDAVLDVRRMTKQRSIGHCGTLDPLATGLLVLCLGRATKVSRFLTDRDKTYDAKIHLGLTSTTYDSEGVDPDAMPHEIPPLSQADILSLLSEFQGTFLQKVPAYSSVRVNGTRLYKLARRGEAVETPEREVTISHIELLEYKEPFLQIRVECGKGTYIRTLAHMFGERIGCGGYLAGLKRLMTGTLSVDDALSLQQVSDHIDRGDFQNRLLPIGNVLDYAAIVVTEEFSRIVVNGPQLHRRDIVSVNGEFSAGDGIVLRNQTGAVLAIGTAGTHSDGFACEDENHLFRYVRVLN